MTRNIRPSAGGSRHLNFPSVPLAASATLDREMKRIVLGALFLPARAVCGRKELFDAHSGLNPEGPQKDKMIMEPRIIISFSPLEAMQAERIALDGDKEEALRMIEKVILKKIREASGPH